MNNSQSKITGIKSDRRLLKASRTKDNWFPSLTLGLLTTVLGMVGVLPTAKADELPELINLGLSREGIKENPTDENLRRSPLALLSAAVVEDEQSQVSEPPLVNLPLATNNTGTRDGTTVPGEQKAAALSTQEAPTATSGVAEYSDESLRIAEPIRPQTPNFGGFENSGSSQNGGDRGASPVATQQSSTPLPANEVIPNQAVPDSTLPPTGVTSPTLEEVEVLPPPTGTVAQTEVPATEPVTIAPNEVRILSPQPGSINTRSTNLVVQYNADAQIQVSVNQEPLDSAIITQQERDDVNNTITQVWYNIPLEKGENTLTVQAGDGTPSSVALTVEQQAVQIEVTPVGDPRVPADGRSLISFQGRITNENGEPLTEDTVVTLTASAGKFVGADEDKDQLGFQVIARDGVFTAQLQSGLEAQKVRIRAAVEELERESEEFEDAPQSLIPAPSPYETYTQIEFVTNLRPSLVSGVINFRIGASGTDFWGSRRDFLNPDLIDEGTDIDLDGAVFATGRIGEWLFTGAYNSDRPLNETCDGITRLFRGPQFCEQQYPVYGDSSTVDYLTPSIDSVYLRFERTSPVFGAEPDYAMWGDYNTQEFSRNSQLFTATTRQLHGFKGNYNLGNLQITALYSPDIDGFQRDTISPNGTSGYYFLSRRLLVEGSETIFLEKEEVNRPGTVVERKPLYRGTDYEIDYDRGTLLFRRPMLATETAFFDTDTGDITEGSTLLVQRIVVTYQYDNAGGDDTNLYAGRLQYNFSQDFNTESWLAATYLREDQGDQDFELYGADFLVSLGASSRLIGEYAHSSNNSPFLGNVTGSAYRLEASADITPSLTGRAYYRSVEEGFVNNATTSFTPGQTRYGAAIAYQLSSSTSLQAGYDYEENYGIAPEVRTDFFDLFNPGVEAEPGEPVNNSLTTIRAGIQQEIGTATLGLDYVNRSRDDRIGDVFDGDASQLVSYLGVPLTEALTFRAQNELNLGDSDPLYPNRTTLGLDWDAYPGVTVRLAHQFFDGGILGRDSLTSLDTILEHRLGENTDLTGRYSIISGFNGVTGQGAVGLNHRWVISPGFRVNLGYEHTFSNTSIVTAAGERFAQPYAPGQSAASLALLGGDVYRVGFEYTDNADFQASANFEHRTGSGNNNTVFSLSAAGKLTPALTILGRYEQANFANQLLEGLDDSATLRLGLAYRDPNSDRWNALLRYEYRRNPASIPEELLTATGTDSNEHLFAAEAIYAPNWRWEFYGKGAMRISSTNLADDFSNSTNVFLSQLRATYRLGYRVDLAVEGRWIGQSSPTYNEFGVAVETGYYLTPDLRLALGYSFGSVDDRDFSGYRSEGGPYLGIVFKLNELFGGFGRQKVSPPQEQESQVEPIASETSDSAVEATSVSQDSEGEQE